MVGIVTPGRLAVPVGAGDHVRGPDQAPITLVEYGHYQSADCASLQPDLDDLLRYRKPQVRLVYRHFPAPPSDSHPYMFVAAEIAEAAAVRHRFWEMHDWMFEHQLALTALGRVHLDDGELEDATVDEAAHLGAQLTILIRGIYYDGWDPSRAPQKMGAEEFFERVRREFPYSIHESTEELVRRVTATVRNHITAGEWHDVTSSLPQDAHVRGGRAGRMTRPQPTSVGSRLRRDDAGRSIVAPPAMSPMTFTSRLNWHERSETLGE